GWRGAEDGRMSSYEPADSGARMPSTPLVPATLRINLTQSQVGRWGYKRLSGAPGVGASQRAGSEGRPEWGKRARPRWFGAQGAESGHEERISPSPHLRRVKDEPSKIAITAC